jgi:hypothetical protein
MTPATRFFDQLLRQYLASGNMPDQDLVRSILDVTRFSYGPRVRVKEEKESYRSYADMLIDPNTKRIVFDARQAKLFDDIDEEIPRHMAGKIYAPFPQFYMEFTEPIVLNEQEPGHFDLTRAFMYSEKPDVHCVIEGHELDVGVVNVFATSEEFNPTLGHRATTYVDNTWWVNLDLGIAITRAGLCRSEPDPSEVPPDWPDEAFVPCGMKLGGIEDRHIGWWERYTSSYTSMFMWMMAYMMAKSVTVIEEPMSRQVRRWANRQKEPPRPWHVVVVEPKFYASGHDPEAEGTGRQHSYRYDVIGHLRFGRHKTRDGYSETIEWVPPHQRGLANTLYIPKTYKVEGGKRVSPRMNEYFGSG